MTDITTIPEEELQQDLRDSAQDIAICKAALKLDIVVCSSGSVQDRLDQNQKIVEIILVELARRSAMIDKQLRWCQMCGKEQFTSSQTCSYCGAAFLRDPKPENGLLAKIAEPGWINVKDLLPTEDADVLIHITSEWRDVITVAALIDYGYGFQWVTAGGNHYHGAELSRITHWMPLPEAPKEEQK